MIVGGGPCPFFSYNLGFPLQVKRSTENFSQVSRLVLDTSRINLAAILRAASTGLPSISPRRLTVGVFSQSFAGASAFQFTELRDSSHQLTLSQSSEYVI
jgi:hypothetical protein